MGMMKVSKNKKFAGTISGFITAAKTMTLAATKDIAREALYYAVMTSPQSSGTYAANWRLSIGSPRPGNIRKRLSSGQEITNDPYQEGDTPAVTEAINSRGSRLSGLKLREKVYLSTRALNESGEDYTWDIEAGFMKFRPVNRSGGRVLARTMDHLNRYVKDRYPKKRAKR